MDPISGQWLGYAEEGRSDLVVLDLDDGPNQATGSGRIFFSDGSPGAICFFQIPREVSQFELDGLPLFWIPPATADLVNSEQIRARFPESSFPDTANVKLERQGSDLKISWSTPIGTTGSAILKRSNMKAPSKIQAQQLNWEEFKKFALQRAPGTFIFRGQPATYKMRTAFHRSYRKDLVKYSVEDIPVAHRQLTARTTHIFDLEKGQERGAFWNLLQHHGYPTPLLDWSYSPFVAAFFAYRRRKADLDTDPKVRILAFDKAAWVGSFNQLDVVNFARPHFSVLEALAIENSRAIPQQSLSTLTNVDDIEEYVLGKEQETDRRYLYAIDLPAESRPNVMIELSLMGITAGSLFPGLDGACEELLGRFFHHQIAPIPAD